MYGRLPESNLGRFNPYEARQLPQLPQSPVFINDNPQVPRYKMLKQVARKLNFNVKTVVVGDGGCGKTCLLVSYAQQKFPEIYVPTIFENYVTSVQLPQGKIIELALWDTAGQEEYDRLRPLSYPDSDVIIICFALDNIVSLQNIKDMWFPEVNHFCPGVPVLLVGTKSDLDLKIDPDLPILLAAEINAIGYVQCLAKTMFNVETVFNFALSHMERQKQLDEQAERSRRRGSKAGHSRNGSKVGHSRNLSKRGHFPSGSMGLSVLLDAPLADDTYVKNPYELNTYNGHGKYNDEEFAFTRKKKSKKCVIL